MSSAFGGIAEAARLRAIHDVAALRSDLDDLEKALVETPDPGQQKVFPGCAHSVTYIARICASCGVAQEVE